MARYKAVGAVKQNKAGNGAQTAEGRVTVLNREIRKGLSWKADICTYHITAAALRQEVEPSGEGGEEGRRPPATGSLACGTGPGGRTRMWPFLKSCGWKGAGPDSTQLGPLTIMVHQGEARRPVRTLL